MNAHATPFVVTPDTVPRSEAQFQACLASWEWRIFSGLLYKITTKGDDAGDDEPEIAVPFRPNANQRRFLGDIHNRNIILKARQMGFSTLIEILALDQALFNAHQEVVVIAQTAPAAAKLYRKKVLFAYDNLPPSVKEALPTTKRTETMVVFANGSSIEVTTSARGGTPHFLHISEFGKIAATNPGKALEITTGSIQGVPQSGLIFIESTAEGQAGAFYEMSQRAQRKAEAKEPLGPMDYRFHFFPWFLDPGYALSDADTRKVRISSKEHEYFDTVEGLADHEITLNQRAWYIQKRDSEFAATPEMMWREYPSTPQECWQTSTEGKYYATVLAIARREGRIAPLPIHRHIPVDTWWDLGAADDTAIWLSQEVGPWTHFIGFHEASGAGYLHFVAWLESQGLIWGAHHLPHDAEQKRQADQAKPEDHALTSPAMILRNMRPSWTFRIVPRVQSIQHGIDATRQAFPSWRIDPERCKEGLAHLENYSREWNTRLQCWHDHPRHDEHSHAADAIRQKAQAHEHRTDRPRSSARKVRRATGMTA